MSNSSLTIYPNNKTSSFTVSLPQKITLPGKWKVAVVEVHYNYNFYNISKGSNQIKLVQKAEGNAIEKFTSTFEIKCGYYKCIDDVITCLNRTIIDNSRTENDVFSFDKSVDRCIVNFNEKRHPIENLFLQERLSMQLGFYPNTNIMKYPVSPHCCNIRFGIPDQMMIYTDIIEPTFISHEKAYVIKIVNTQAKNLDFGDACYVEFKQWHYMNVQKREFDSISIDIRDHTGNFMPFQHGIFTIKLHFKKHHG